MRKLKFAQKHVRRNVFGGLIAMLLLILIPGCEGAADCVLDINPSLPEKEFAQATMFTSYDESLQAEMNNAADTNYGITGIRVSGNLPPGLTCTANGMDISIQGTPTALGTFEFNIKITVGTYLVDAEGADDHLCGDSASKKYSITVN